MEWVEDVLSESKLFSTLNPPPPQKKPYWELKHSLLVAYLETVKFSHLGTQNIESKYSFTVFIDKKVIRFLLT